MWDLIVLIPDHCRTIYFTYHQKTCPHKLEALSFSSTYTLTVFRVVTLSGKDDIFNVGKTNSYFLNCGYKQVWINYDVIYYTENSFSMIGIISTELRHKVFS